MNDPTRIAVRAIVSPCRSASTALLQLLAQHPEVHCVYQPVKTGLRRAGRPDYGIYHGLHPVFGQRPAFVVAKETLGHSTLAECTLDPFGNDDVMARVRPLFVFRHPVETWSSWKRLGWGSLELFLQAYSHAQDLMTAALVRAPGAMALTAESLSDRREAMLRRVCEAWGLPFSARLLGGFATPVFEDARVHMDEAARQYSMARGSHDMLRQSATFALPAAREELVTRGERRAIERNALPFYEDVHAREDRRGIDGGRPPLPASPRARADRQ